MSYVVLARKWRPKRFEDLVGQEHVSRTLRNAIRIDRIAHAFLFTGVRGVGKTSAARILAMALNCHSGDAPTPEPCGSCDSCTRIMNATCIDVQEIDGASNNSVEDVRRLRETVAFQPSSCRMKVYIIDEVHMLTPSAFNALLKTLEEPPPHVKFIFATTEPHRIPVTILSRCQRYDFRRIPPKGVEEHLGKILTAEAVSIEPEALALLAKEAQGSMRDAVSLLDQALAAFEGTVTLKDVSWLMGIADHRVHIDITRAVLERRPGACLEILSRLDRDGYNLPHFTTGYMEHVRDLIVAKTAGANAPGAEIPLWERQDIEALVADTSLPELYRIFGHIAKAADDITRSVMPRVLLETTFIKLSQNEPLTTIARLLQALGDLKRKGGLQPPPASRPHEPREPDAPSPSGTASPAVESAESIQLPQAHAQPEGLIPGWRRILSEAGVRSPILARILEKATPIRVDANEVRIGFDTESNFDSAFACEKESILTIQAACEQALGARPMVIVERNSEAANLALGTKLERRRQEEEKRRRSAIAHPMIKQVQDQLGAKIKDIKTDVE